MSPRRKPHYLILSERRADELRCERLSHPPFQMEGAAGGSLSSLRPFTSAMKTARRLSIIDVDGCAGSTPPIFTSYFFISSFSFLDLPESLLFFFFCFLLLHYFFLSRIFKSNHIFEPIYFFFNTISELDHFFVLQVLVLGEISLYTFYQFS